MSSAGTGSDALDINATAGGIDVDANAVLALDGAGGLNIGTASDVAVDFNARTLDVDASDEVTIDAASSSGISLDASAASNFATSAGALTLTSAAAATWSTGAGVLTLEGAGGVTVTSTSGAMTLNGSGQTVDVDGAAIDIDAAGSTVGFTNTADSDDDDFTIEQVGAHNSSLIINSAGTGVDAIAITASAGGMDITSSGVMDITTSGNSSNITVDPNGSGTLALGSADNTAVTVDAIALSLNAAGGASNITLASDGDDDDLTIGVTGANNASLILSSQGTGADAIKLSTNAGGVTVDVNSGSNSTDDFIVSANNFSVNAAGVMNVGGALTASSFSGDMTSNALTTDSQNLTVSTTTSGNIILDAVDDIDIDADGDQINMKFGGATGHLSLTNANSGDIEIKQETDGKNIIFRDQGDVATFTIEDAATGIVVPGEVKTTKLSYTDGTDAITVAADGALTVALRATADAGIDVDNLVLDNNSLISSSGALTLTSAGAATWSTGAGALTIDGAGGLNLSLIHI